MYVKEFETELMQVASYRVQKSLYVYASPVIVVVGLLGNVISLLVLLGRPMRHVSTYCYLAVLSVVDSIVLGVGLLPKWLDEAFGIDVRSLSELTCRAGMVTLYSASDCSVWLIIAVTVERYVAVCRPLHAATICRRRRAAVIMVGLALAFVTVNSHFIWTTGLRSVQVPGANVTDCRGAEGYETLVADVWPWVDAVIYAFIPFFVILVLNCIIISHLATARRLRASLSARQVGEGRSRSGTVSDADHDVTNRRLVVTLLFVSFAFLVTTLPRSAALIIAAFIQHFVRSSDPLWSADATVTACRVRLALTSTDLLMYSNHAINFFLYCAAGQKFRRQLCELVCQCRAGVTVARAPRTALRAINTLDPSKPTSPSQTSPSQTEAAAAAARQHIV